jgi:SAM-dependent methyltransferase
MESGKVDYDHGHNLHTVEGPARVLSALVPRLPVRSVLDVGCGRGTWIKASLACGIQEVMGVDGVPLSPTELLFAPERFHVWDLRQPLALDRRFDLVLCLEVGEHLAAEHARVLVGSLARHSDTVLFSAACPGQTGQHHVNCQWPVYWQALFNDAGYVCDDWLRWAIWSDARIEPWYRQNLFLASRDVNRAGKERRLPSVVHAEMLRKFESAAKHQERHATLSKIANGEMPLGWILTLPLQNLWRKARRRWRLDSPDA